MKLKFLGTGAADWTARDAGSAEYRRNASALINESILIDGTVSIRDSLAEIAGCEAMLYTHSHSDHFDLAFQKLLAPKRAFAERSWAEDACAEPVSPLAPFSCAGHTILPVPANHSTDRKDETPLHFILSDGEKKLLYATDGGWLTNLEYHAILENGPMDAIVFDGTVGDDFPNDWRVFEHNTLPMVRAMRLALLKMGALKADAPVFVTHLAKTLHPSQKEIEAREQALGGVLTIAYDGMQAEI